MAEVWCNGEWMEVSGFSLTPTDRGGILGFALFETMLAVDGLPKFVEFHRRRWEESCHRLGWVVPEMDLDKIGSELLARNGLVKGRGRLRLTMTAGSGSVFSKKSGSDGKIWLMATPVEPVPEKVAVLVSPWLRNEKSPLAGLKTASYAENILALDHAHACGYDETLFFNTSAHLCEAATSNVFIVRDNRILTPPLDSGCLPGVTRAVVIRLAESMGLTCLETSLERLDLENSDEIFLTSATRGPVPVSKLNERSLPSAPVTESIRAAWNDEICRP